jgi:Xaa-Pro dipeptidase
MEACKPGVNWIDMHILSEKVILEGLVELGLLTGDVQEMLDGRIGFIFMPHGLGHFIGLETHDVGGYLKHTPARIMKPGLKNCRFNRELHPGMAFTIEPGIYFRDFLIDGDWTGQDLKIDRKYLNVDKIREYQAEVGGVRIEDCCIMGAEGTENMCHLLPRTVAEIEKCMAGEEWK